MLWAGTDKVIANFFEKSGDALLSLLRVNVDDKERIYPRVRVIKQQEIRPDFEITEITIEEEPLRVYIEVQGYFDRYVLYRAISGALLASKMDDYRGRILIGVIYLRRAYMRGVLKPIGEKGNMIEIREICIEEYDIKELVSIDKRLVIFLPYTRGIRRKEDLVRGYKVVEDEVSGLDKDLLDQFIMMVISRFKRLSIWEVRDMFRIDVKDSVAFKEMYEMGIKDGIQQGIQQGIQRGIKQGIQQGFREGEYKKAIEIARALYELGVDLEKIKRATKLSIDELKRILSE